jgi:hypothetical protein
MGMTSASVLGEGRYRRIAGCYECAATERVNRSLFGRLRQETTTELLALQEALPTLDSVRHAEHPRQADHVVPRLRPDPEPRNLR